MQADGALGFVARADFTFDKQLQHRGDRAMFSLGDLLQARMRLRLKANSDTRTGSRRSIWHAVYLHQNDAPFKGEAIPDGRVWHSRANSRPSHRLRDDAEWQNQRKRRIFQTERTKTRIPLRGAV